MPNVETILLIVILVIIKTTIAVVYFNLKSKENFITILFYLTIFGILSSTFLNSLISFISNKQYLPYRIATIIESTFFFIFFSSIIHGPKFRKTLIVTSLALFTLIVTDLIVTKANNFDSKPTVLESILFLSFSICYFFQELNKPISTTFIYNTPLFWFVSGIMLYFSICFFFFINAEANQSSEEFQTNFQIVMLIASLIQSISFLIGFLVKKYSKEFISNQVKSPLAKININDLLK